MSTELLQAPDIVDQPPIIIQGDVSYRWAVALSLFLRPLNEDWPDELERARQVE